MTTQLDFLAEHGAHLRQALIMIEGEDGAFRLIAHGAMAAPSGGKSLAVMRSANTDREYLFVHGDRAARRCTFSWHRATRAELMELMRDLGARPGDDPFASIVKHIGASENAQR